MHELAIAGHVVDIAARHAEGRKVTKVYLKVGHLRQVVPSALTFSFDLVAQGTTIEGATLILEEVPATGRCRECGAESALKTFPFQCEACGASSLEITQGEELYVESLEMEGQEDEKLIAEG
ncbi:hydrogenase maturation nickel metallochaperone HypA [Rubrobacter tropicus]|uniref:Hydrogenase maturation factor HypA n=1 Tax=Rubrobacter tropicus TaxID=2653851 RepID=A0A6G8QA64_9ACTN|nr:hydrogenase maturation nickel metallochaperone HypA [Rubrobacter tropicus]QIN83384.1 hydrogenase maturation nickel metallochaperone HypA [Rubrobacter tropicus]